MQVMEGAEGGEVWRGERLGKDVRDGMCVRAVLGRTWMWVCVCVRERMCARERERVRPRVRTCVRVRAYQTHLDIAEQGALVSDGSSSMSLLLPGLGAAGLGCEAEGSCILDSGFRV